MLIFKQTSEHLREISIKQIGVKSHTKKKILINNLLNFLALEIILDSKNCLFLGIKYL